MQIVVELQTITINRFVGLSYKMKSQSRSYALKRLKLN